MHRPGAMLLCFGLAGYLGLFISDLTGQFTDGLRDLNKVTCQFR